MACIQGILDKWDTYSTNALLQNKTSLTQELACRVSSILQNSTMQPFHVIIQVMGQIKDTHLIKTCSDLKAAPFVVRIVSVGN